MCFSALASFTTAGFTGLLGIAALARTREPRQWPLAAAPLLFAIQQSAEGVLWLLLPASPHACLASGATLLFQTIALTVWPLYVPAAILLIEPSASRRRLIAALLVLGACISAYLARGLVMSPPGAAILGGHIVYGTANGQSSIGTLVYLAATAAPLLLSSYKTIVALGAFIATGYIIALLFYWSAFLSVWCFFAAAASVMIFGFVESERRWPVAAA